MHPDAFLLMSHVQGWPQMPSVWHHHISRDDGTRVTYLVFGHLWLKLLGTALGPIKTKRRDSLSWKRLIPIALCWGSMPGPGAAQFCAVATRHSALPASPDQADGSTSRKSLADSRWVCLCFTVKWKISEQSLDLGIEPRAACCLPYWGYRVILAVHGRISASKLNHAYPCP